MELNQHRATHSRTQNQNLELKNCLMGILGTLIRAEELRVKLINEGCSKERILILQGQEGMDAADWAPGSGGIVGKLKEILMRYSDMGAVIDRFEEAWKSGKTTITIDIEGLANPDYYAKLIKQNGGTDIHKFEGMTFVEMDPRL